MTLCICCVNLDVTVLDWCIVLRMFHISEYESVSTLLISFGFVARLEHLDFDISAFDLLNCGQSIGPIGNSAVLVNWFFLSHSFGM